MIGLFEAEISALTSEELNEMSVRDLKNILYYNGVEIPTYLENKPRVLFFGLFSCSGAICGMHDRIGLISLVRDALKGMIASNMKEVEEMDLKTLSRFLNQRGVSAVLFNDLSEMVKAAQEILLGYLKTFHDEAKKKRASSHQVAAAPESSAWVASGGDELKAPLGVRKPERPSFDHVKSVFAFEPDGLTNVSTRASIRSSLGSSQASSLGLGSNTASVHPIIDVE